MVKNLPSNARDAGSIPASARMKGGKGCTLQCSCLGNPMDRAAWQAIATGSQKSQSWLSDSTRTKSLVNSRKHTFTFNRKLLSCGRHI